MIAENIAQVQASIAQACERAGRSPQSVTLVAVTKTKPVTMIREAIDAGLRHFGENRVEEASEKIPQITTPDVHWHMIGHVQSRKAKQVVPLFDLIHSLDSLKLADKYARLAQEHNRTLNVLLQMNVSGEESKEGLDAVNWEADADKRAALWAETRAIAALPALNITGLMTVAPFTDDEGIIRPVFASLRRLRDALSEELARPLPQLSMGMTDDYPIAIEEGATIIRIGRAIFGERS